MRDVAKAAGVSVATVSHVVNDKPGARIGDDARERVQRGRRRARLPPERPREDARRSGSSTFIGLVADAIATTPFAGQIIHGAQDEAWKHGYVLLVANTDGNAAAEDAGDRDDARAQGARHPLLHLVPPRRSTVPAALHETDAVLVDCFSEDSGLPAVVPDEVQGGRTATRAAARRRPPAHRLHQHHHPVTCADRPAARDTARRSRPPGIEFDPDARVSSARRSRRAATRRRRASSTTA